MASKYFQPRNYSRFGRRYSSNSDDDSIDLEDCATDSDKPLIFEELKKKYDVETLGDARLQIYANSQDKQDIFEELVEEIEKLKDKDDRSCSSCATQVRVVKTASFRSGQHIAKPGNHFRRYFKSIKKQVCPYDHHMIVKEVKKTSLNKAEMILIHFMRSKDDCKIKICETTETFDLRFDEIYRVDYPRPRYSRSQIVQRAESMLPESRKDDDNRFQKYNVLSANCEHFATWCVVGEGDSIQVQGLRQKIKDAVFGVFGNTSSIAKGIIQILLNSSDEISAGLTNAANVPGLVLTGMAGLYLIYCIFMTVLHIRDYRERRMCWSCWKKNVLDLWLSFGVFGVTSAIQLILCTFALPLIPTPVGVPLIIVVILLSIGLQVAVPRLTKMLRSPFLDEGNEVAELSEINVGDIVQLQYFKLDHIVLVTEVHEGRKSLRAIHYAAPLAPLGDITVTEEYFKVDLNKSKIKVIDTTAMKCYPPDVAVRRARKRLGETKFDPLTNRSSHLCYWAKVDFRQNASGEIEDSELGESRSTERSSLHVGKEEVHLIDELELGDVVSFGKFSVRHISFIETKGIIVNISGNRIIELELIVHKNMHVRREFFSLDLKKERLFVHKYAPGHCKTMNERKRSAEKMEDNFFFCFTTDNFIEACIMLKPK